MNEGAKVVMGLDEKNHAELVAYIQNHLALVQRNPLFATCLLYTSDAADERSSVDLGGRRIIKKKKTEQQFQLLQLKQHR